MDALHRRMIARVRALAAARGITLSHLPDRAGVGRSDFYNVLAGKKSPTLRWLTKIATALEADPADLLSKRPR